MTELRIEKIKIPKATFGDLNTLPSISENLRLSFMKQQFELGESDGLFVNYGMVDYGFPYKAQDNYGRDLIDTDLPCAVLENEHLKAVFLPHFGGKLHSLYDKDEGKELLFSNSVLRPCHLGVRNAWMSGGVEWNCGYVGHNAFTCDLMHTAKGRLDDGTPFLRFYQYERIREIVYQMDFFLPEGSRLMFGRMKIVNPKFEVVPMYWWSNIATPDEVGNRVIVPATTTYTARDSHPVKISIPEYNGIDVTYPADNVLSIDYFWNIPDNERKFITQVDKNGYGLVQTSTARLKGRKLFVWGNSTGGDRWKGFLTADGESGSYNEIQAGLAKTQYECIPMPPKTTWEWLEAYGAIHASPDKAHGEWRGAIEECSLKLDGLITEQALEDLLASTKRMANSPAEQVLFCADGWGALEQERRKIQNEDPMCEYLDFGAISEEQAPWLTLVKDGTLGVHDPKSAPVSYMLGDKWYKMLQNATQHLDRNNWFSHLQLGLMSFIGKDFRSSKEQLEASVEITNSPWALYALAILNRELGKNEEEVEFMLRASAVRADDLSLSKEVLRSLYNNEQYGLLKKTYEQLPEHVRNTNRCKVYYAFALLSDGDVSGAEKILYEDGGIIVPDIRECETVTLDLWIAIEEKKAQAAGIPFDKNDINPPAFADFRMFSNIDWLNGGEIIRE
jgi:hypothetical protein